jgi:type VI secretion system protein ImpF
VRRDLEWLLNSRRIAVEPDADLTEVNDSLYVLGLADVMSFGLSDAREQVRLLGHLEETIRRFEPRLANVRITQQEDISVTRGLRFRIEAALLIDPAPERISFDTVLQMASGEYSVREAN